MDGLWYHSETPSARDEGSYTSKRQADSQVLSLGAVSGTGAAAA